MTEPQSDATVATETQLKSRDRRWLVLAIVLAALLAFWLLRSRGDNDASAPPSRPMVTVSTPLVRNLDTRLDFSGQLSAVDQVELRAQVGGTLTGIHFRDGSVVRRGQLLFTIDPRPFRIRLDQTRAAVSAASARLALATRELKRARALQAGEAGTVQNVEQREAEARAAQAALADAQAQTRDAQLDLEHARVVAPFTGRIGAHLVSIGNLVSGSRAGSSPTTLLATIVSLDPIHLDFDMSETDYGTFERQRAGGGGTLGNTVAVRPAGSSGFTRTGVLDFLDNAIDRSSGTIRARATVSNAALDLTPGAFAQVRLPIARPVPTLLVPDTAVTPDQSRHSVMVVSADGKVAAREVQIGDLRGGLRVIRSGLAPTDCVVIDGLSRAAPGAAVVVQRGTIRFDEAAGGSH
jgi:multidrug efflux system membrane fusion protein